MKKDIEKRWQLIAKKIRDIDSLHSETDNLNIKNAEDTIKTGSGKIIQNLVEVESFLRGVIKESNM